MEKILLQTTTNFWGDYREHPQTHLKDFTGILQADGYAGFGQLYEIGRIQETACWAHVRRIADYPVNQVADLLP